MRDQYGTNWDKRLITKKENVPNLIHLRWFLSACLIVAVVTKTFLFFKAYTNQNHLSYSSSLAEKAIPINVIKSDRSLISFDELLNSRKLFFANNHELLSSPYVLRDVVFGSVDQDLPWWSEEGYYAHGFQSKIVPGIPVVAHGIINPLLLAVPEFWSFSHWAGEGNKIKDLSNFKKSQLGWF